MDFPSYKKMDFSPQNNDAYLLQIRLIHKVVLIANIRSHKLNLSAELSCSHLKLFNFQFDEDFIRQLNILYI